MKGLIIYFTISTIIGIFQIIDGIILSRNEGRYVRFNIIFSLFEFLWFIVCFIILGTFSKYGAQKISPAVFIFYNLFGGLFGILMMRRVKDPRDIIIPKWFIACGILFGVFFVTINIKELLIMLGFM